VACAAGFGPTPRSSPNPAGPPGCRGVGSTVSGVLDVRADLGCYGDGGPWLPPTFSTFWARFAQANGLDGVTFHTLRQGTATLLLAAGVPDAVVISIMGHADTAILRRYQEVVPDLMRDATARLEALLAD
jgi:integrase